jgi:hypothetical protein
MTTKALLFWFSVVSCVLIIAGIVFSIFGFSFFPIKILPSALLLPWVSAIYGSVLIGWGTTLFLVGRIAFNRNDKELLQSLFIGLSVWLIIEAIVSGIIGVYFNMGVDLVVLILFGIPLMSRFRKVEGQNNT